MDVAELLREVHGRVPPLVEAAVADLGPDDLTWAPAPEANTIGWLVWHLTRVLDHHLADLLGDTQLLPTFGDRFGRAPDADEIGYGAALSELESILSEIEDDAVDVDVLATRVRRAAELLRICRDRIASARVEVTQIVADLEQGAGTVDLTTTDLDD